MILPILVLLSGLLSIAMAVIVLAEGARTKTMRMAYSLFAGSVGLWAVFLGLFLLTSSSMWAQAYVYLYYSLGLLIPYSFLLFSMAYLSIRVSLGVRLFALLPWVVMSIVIAIPNGMITAIVPEINSVTLVQSTYLIYSAIFILYVAIGIFFLIRKAARARGALVHRRIVAISLAVGFAGGGFFDIILPLLGNYSLIAYGPLFAFVTSVGVFYVIARHGLFDIRTAVVRTVTYLLSIMTVVAVYLLAAFGVFSVALGQTLSPLQIGLNIGLALLIALLIRPIKTFFDAVTNKLFFKGKYNVDDFYQTVSKTLNSTSELRTLLKRTALIIGDTLKSEEATFILYRDRGRVSVVGTEGHTSMPLKDAHMFDTASDAMVRGINASNALARIMATYRYRIVLPLRREDEGIGLLCLGEHRSSRYTRRDIKVLNTISNELSIAIQNAMSIQEVRDLNANLEQRIDASTSELRRSNSQLHRLDEAKDEFISMASHQLRTPLTSIKGYLSMLIEGDLGDLTKEQKHVLNEAFVSSERMVRLIGDFLNVSRLQTGKFVIDKRPVDLARLVERELDGLESNARARNMKFAYKKPKNIPMVELDENKIEQVIMNFADNAIYYSNEKDTITVSLKKVDNFVEFTVKDNGIGVPEEEQEHLFTKFYRAGNARKARPDGTGVGLFLAKKVIDDHGGSIIMHSIEGQGSTFGFRLPIIRIKK